MKCPKCSYLSFEPSDRCRNCGYDFSLAVTAAPAATEVRIDTIDESLEALDLALAPRPSAHAAEPALDLDRLIGAPPRAVPDLPLFAQVRLDAQVGLDRTLERKHEDDRPLIAPRPTPRPPLAVRRTAETARLRALKMRNEPVGLPLGPVYDEGPAGNATDQTAPTIAWTTTVPAGWARRLMAAIVDGAILSGIDAAVLYFTLQLCGLALIDLRIVPLAPFTAFLLMLNGGYLIAFTAMGGQTIGKMATGIQVVGGEGPVDFAHAALRAAGYVVSLLPAGLGLIPALFGEDRRTLHDRLADTRVIRV